MAPLTAILLGLLQGLTEFLPISSSGHLVLAEKLLGLKGQDLTFVVFVHFGTLLSTVTVFWPQVWRMVHSSGLFLVGQGSRKDPHLQLAGCILVGTIPAAIVGLLFEDSIERIFSNALFVSCMLLLTGLILWLTQYVSAGEKAPGLRQSILVGCAQAVAILPGISRSGATVSAALFQHLERVKAVEFSFLLALPAILGATALKAIDLMKSPPPSANILSLLLGTLVAYLSGYLTIKAFLKVVRQGKLRYFSLYCWAVGLVGLLCTL